MKQSGHYFSEYEKEKICAAVKSAEANTSGEIATMVVPQSSSYREAETLGALLLSALLAFIVEGVLEYIAVTNWNDTRLLSADFFFYGGSLWTFIPMVFLFFFPLCHLFRRWPLLKLSFTGKRRINEAVRDRAVRAFFEKRLYKTRDENGILVFISLLERKVWILGDRGINEKIPHLAWRGLVKELTQGIREGVAADSLCSLISSIGIELERHFPKKSDDVNELSDNMLT